MKTAGVLVLLVFAFVFSVTPSCKQESATSEAAAASNGSNDGTRVISKEEFAKGIKKNGVVILDVRHTGDFEKSHMDNAININFFDPEFKHKVLELDRSKPYYVYCKNEVCSYRAMEFMKKNDFKEVYTLKGGYEAWNTGEAESK